MAVQLDQTTGDLVINGWEKGIAPSPTQGIANMQGVNTTTEMGEVMKSFSRFQQTQTIITIGTLTATDTTHWSITSVTPSGTKLVAGNWILVSAGTAGLSGLYYVRESSGSSAVLLTNYYAPPSSGTPIITTLGDTAIFNTIYTPANPIASCSEPYNQGSEYRYYILDSNGAVWMYDTLYPAQNNSTPTLTLWFNPDGVGANGTGGITNASGIAVINGWLMVFAGNTIWCKSTVNLGNKVANSTTWVSFASGVLTSQSTSTNPHTAFVGHNNILYYCDGNVLGSIFPNNTTGANAIPVNVQSFSSYSAITTAGTINTVISGGLPYIPTVNTQRIPAYFFTDSAGTQPSNLTAGTIYWILYAAGTPAFTVFAAQTGGSAINIASGAAGNQYFNTFDPIDSGAKASYTWTPQNLQLPFYETAQCMAEIDTNLIVGTTSNILYVWNQINPLQGGTVVSTANDIMFCPERNVTRMITINNIAYLLAGNKGNVYLCTGSTVIPVLTIPDYCAGVPDSQGSYIEPYFVWGDMMFLRGRLYVSIQDQTVAGKNGAVYTKAGNCGGIWSFVPVQAYFAQQDQGTGLRLENQNSYGTYNGMASVLLPMQAQNAIAPQYFSGWASDAGASPAYGIDSTFQGIQSLSAGASNGYLNVDFSTPNAVIETDLIPTGTMLKKKTFSQIEYKLSAPLNSNDIVSISYRQNATDAWTSCGTIVNDGSGLSGYYPANFEVGQWLQLQIQLVSSGFTFAGNSGVRLKEIRIR